MKKSDQITTQAQLEDLIELYFNGKTTLEQEATLRHTLAQCPWQSDTIDDARVVMGFFASHRQQQRRHCISVNRRRHLGIAATIAVLVALGGYAVLHRQQGTDDVCVAYVNGKTINNDQDVMSLIKKDLSNMDDASQGMAAQLSNLGEALELDNE